jgi:hypothetical protein
MATKKTDVAVKSDSELAFSQEVPEYVKQDQARGSEEVKSSDMVLPRLEIVQSQSPIKDENDEAKEGFLFNSVTQEVLGDLVYFVPVYFRLEYLVWKDKDEGGGFFGAFPTESEAKARLDEAVQDGENPEHLEVVDTPVHYGLRITPDGRHEQIVISMAKTKAKVSRKFNSMVQIAGGDRFSRVYKVGTFKDENAKGQKFYNFTIAPAGWAPEFAYNAAEALYAVFKTQDIRAAHETVIDAGSESTEPANRGGI